MKNLLVPTDYSANAFNAYVYALGIASKIGADVTAVHTFELPVIDPRAPSRTAQAIVENEKEEQVYLRNKELPKMTQKAAEMGLHNQPKDLLVLEGEIVEQICHVAAKIGIDLLVMGTKGASGLKEVFFGSNAAKMLEQATCPILAVPETAVFNGINKVAYFTNFDDADVKTLEQLLTITQPFSPDLYLVHIIEADDQHANALSNLKSLCEVVKTITNQPIHLEVSKSDNLHTGMLQFAKEHNMDMIAMLSHKRGFFEKLFNPSSTQKTVQHTDMPMLSFRKI